VAWEIGAISGFEADLHRANTKPLAFGNKSQLKTWLVGILKHKVIDVLRVQTRESRVNFELDGDGSEALDALLIAQEDHRIAMNDRVALRLHVYACNTCPNFE
jgi:RNA polymerase sigma-70 factor (ECF subfamily)